MSDKKLWEQYVALEKERDTLRSDLAEFQYAAAVANDTIKALQAKIEQMERQEPECEVVGQVRNVLYEVRTLKYDLPAGTKLYALPGASLAPGVQDESVRKAWTRFSNELHSSPDAPYPGMSDAFERHFSQSFTDREWRSESGTWAAAWKAAKRHDAQPAPDAPSGWLQHAARMAVLARKLREPDWHFESIREMQRELCALEDAALAAAPETRQ